MESVPDFDNFVGYLYYDEIYILFYIVSVGVGSLMGHYHTIHNRNFEQALIFMH